MARAVPAPSKIKGFLVFVPFIGKLPVDQPLTTELCQLYCLQL